MPGNDIEGRSWSELQSRYESRMASETVQVRDDLLTAGELLAILGFDRGV